MVYAIPKLVNGSIAAMLPQLYFPLDIKKIECDLNFSCESILKYDLGWVFGASFPNYNGGGSIKDGKKRAKETFKKISDKRGR